MTSVESNVNRNLLSDFDATTATENEWIETKPSNHTESQKQKRGITCSFCKCVGHNIRHCNSNSKTYLHEQIKWYLTVSDDGNYARLSNEEFAIIVEMHLQTADIANLSMFCVILNLPIEKRKPDLVSAVKERITSVRYARKFMYDQQVAELRMNEEKKRMREDVEILMNRKEHILQVERLASESVNSVYELLAENMNEIFRNLLVDFCRNYEFVNYAVLMSKITKLESEYHETIPVKNVLISEPKPQEECPVCYEMISDDKICITQCSHTFCYDCVTKVIQTTEEHKCPYCREKIVELSHPVCDETCANLINIYCIGFNED